MNSLLFSKSVVKPVDYHRTGETWYSCDVLCKRKRWSTLDVTGYIIVHSQAVNERQTRSITWNSAVDTLVNDTHWLNRSALCECEELERAIAENSKTTDKSSGGGNLEIHLLNKNSRREAVIGRHDFGGWSWKGDTKNVRVPDESSCPWQSSNNCVSVKEPPIAKAPISDGYIEYSSCCPSGMLNFTDGFQWLWGGWYP